MTRLDVRELVDSTPWIDTHEHLIEESTRLRPPVADSGFHPCEDWAYLLWHYALDDLQSAGLSDGARSRFISPDVGPEEKWALIAPFHERASNTAYIRAARLSIERLFGLALGPGTVSEITRRMQDRRRPGFYAETLRLAGISRCQVNSVEHTFCSTAQPDLLNQDIGLTDFIHPAPARVRSWETATGRSIGSPDDLLDVIDEYFTRFGSRAVAVKLGVAYVRPLLLARHRPRIPAAAFREWIGGRTIDPGQSRAIEDLVLDRGLSRAADHHLPMKVHTGYQAGVGRMDLHQVKENVGDVCVLARRYSTTFIVMHMGYPYEHEVLAAVKQYANVVADLCWAWIVDPLATRLFLKRFLVTAPASKLLSFGGDYIPVENVVGHAAIARAELSRALIELTEEGYLGDADLRELIPKLMHGNAEAIFAGPGSAPAA